MGSGPGGKASAVSAGVGSIDPSNLHLKKELTQIRKAARVLRDPGTSSTWRSPLNSARSISKHHYVHHHKNAQFDATSDQVLHSNANNNHANGNVIGDKGNVGVKEEGRVFLYNWRNKKSENKQIDGDDGASRSRGEGHSTQEDESVDLASLSDARNGNDSRSDTYSSERYPSAMFRRTDANFTRSIRRGGFKKKLEKGNYSGVGLRHHNDKLRKVIKLNRYRKNGVETLSSMGLGRDDLVDQSDDTAEYCNSEDLWRTSAISPFLAKLKNKGWAHSPAKRLRNHRKEDDSTPALSVSSYNKYCVRYPSAAESWDATTGSFNDADDEVDDQLDFSGRQGCGIPCYWSKRSTPKSRSGYGSCSPALSEALRRKGSSIFCGGQSIHQRLNKSGHTSRTAGQSLVPLLNNKRGSSMGSENSDDAINTNFGELDLEALSRLDGRRWSSSCRSQEVMELVAINGEESSSYNVRSLSHRFRPMFFDELIGQNIVVQSLVSAISSGRIVPVYLFQGPRGTGKTSTARIFAAALNCLSTEKTKPCGFCKECVDFASSKSTHLREIDASSKNEIRSIKSLLKGLPLPDPSSLPHYNVFVVNECHLLPSKAWLTFLRLLDKPPRHVIFILVTTDIDNLPRTILSRCQKHIFNKISNSDIITCLSKIATEENLDVDLNALELIASNADGSLHDAETMLDQLSLFGKRITISMVNELIGVVPEENLLDLLELAMSSDATETVIRARVLLDSGVDPIVLMSQMATLIVDIIGGTLPNADGKHSRFFGGRKLSDIEVDKLKHGLTLLSEAEKHLRVSNDRATWFTATLLQFGSLSSPDRTQSGSRRLSSKSTDKDNTMRIRETTSQKQRIDTRLLPDDMGSPRLFRQSAQKKSTNKDNQISLAEAGSQDDGGIALRCVNSKMLDDVWLQCIDKCHSKTLRQLLHLHGRLVSISQAQGTFVAYIAFEDKNIKTRAEGFLSSITNSFETVVRHNVEVKIIQLPASMCQNLENKSSCSNIVVGNSNLGLCQEPKQVSRGNFSFSENRETENFEFVSGDENLKDGGKSNVPVKRIEAIVQEQRLETAWLQAMDKGTPGSMNRVKPVRNQVLPQDGVYPSNGPEPMISTDAGTQEWEDELNNEIKALKVSNAMTPQKDRIMKRIDHCPISPSLLHNRNFKSNPNKDNRGYESGPGVPGCSGMFCWNHNKPQRRARKAKQGTPLRTHKTGRFTWFDECTKSRKMDRSRFNR